MQTAVDSSWEHWLREAFGKYSYYPAKFVEPDVWDVGRVRIRFDRGMIVEVKTGMHNFISVAPCMFAHEPITSVVILDREPRGFGDGLIPNSYRWDIDGGGWSLRDRGFNPHNPATIPLPLSAIAMDEGIGSAHLFPDREPAIDALHRWCLKFGRMAAAKSIR